LGGAHWDYDEAAANLKPHLIETIKELQEMDVQERIEKRIEKFGVMGFWDEVEVPKREPVTEENNQ
jgi:acetyl-CoA carboxylase carboxyl transferase subunit alpha